MAGANEGVALVKEDAVDLALVYAPVEDASWTCTSTPASPST